MASMNRAVCFSTLSSSGGRRRGLPPGCAGGSSTWQNAQFTPSAYVNPRMIVISESRGRSFEKYLRFSYGCCCGAPPPCAIARVTIGARAIATVAARAKRRTMEKRGMGQSLRGVFGPSMGWARCGTHDVVSSHARLERRGRGDLRSEPDWTADGSEPKTADGRWVSYLT